MVVHFVCSSWGDSGGEGRSDLQKRMILAAVLVVCEGFGKPKLPSYLPNFLPRFLRTIHMYYKCDVTDTAISDIPEGCVSVGH